MPITATPNPLPSRSLLQQAFDAAMAAFMTYLPTFVANTNALETNVNAKSINCDSQATAASGSAAAALASQNASATSANAAAAAAGAATWANTGALYAIGDLRKSPSNARIYRRLTASTAGTTDPAVDVTNWAIWSLDPIWVKKTANYTAIAGEAILADTSAGTWTLLLPAVANANDTVRLADYIGTFATNKVIVGRNGNKINAMAEDMDVTSAWLPEIKFTYVDATVGWRTL